VSFLHTSGKGNREDGSSDESAEANKHAKEEYIGFLLLDALAK